MKITAIICEYNPMTNGHTRHMSIAREETGADTILSVMSGSFVQRGDAAIVDKYIRATSAIVMGSDIVVELPTIYAISPADNFAYGALKTISAFKDVEYISFGSECGDINTLQKVADLLYNEPESFSLELQANLKQGYSYPKSRALATAKYVEENPDFSDIAGILDEPNNVLGVSYLTAIKKLGLNIKAHTIKREGGGYNDDSITSAYPSATAVRQAIRRGELDKMKESVPNVVYESLRNMSKNNDSLNDMMLFKIKSLNGYDLEHYYDVTGGIHNRIKIAAINATSLEQMLEQAKTKNYTMARLKRICLYSLFDITQKMYEESVAAPLHVSILAIKKSRKKELLSSLAESCPNVLTKYSDIHKVDKAVRPLIKLDFISQGTLEIINRANYLNKKMIIIDDKITE
ncbi:MAG: nucleotidyltransferase family protein [Bacillota bacterium]